MSLKFSCPQCGKKLTAKEGMAGRRLTCPNCQSPLTVPQPPADPSDVQAGGKKEKKPSGREHPLLLVPGLKSHPDDLIDMTAMVDIVFFLLIFFMVTSLQAVEAVINLPDPEPQEASAPSVMTSFEMMDDPNTIVVTIEKDDSVWVEGKETHNEVELRNSLREAQGEEQKRNSMLVLSHPEATSGAFVLVLDAGADTGITNLTFEVEE